MKNNKIISILICTSFLICTLFIVGCSTNNSNNIISSIVYTMSKVTNTLDNVKNFETNELIIPEFMDEKNLTSNISRNELVESDDKLSSYFTQISKLNDKIVLTVNVNDRVNNLKRQIYAKTSHIKALCSQYNDAKIEFNDAKIKGLKELNQTITINNTRISLTRNEITNNYKNVEKLKKQYNTASNQLLSRYIKLENSLNNRLTYYNNMLSSLDELAEILCDNKYYSQDNQSNDETSIYDNEKENTSKTGITKNIDTYENAGTNIYGDIRNNPIYNPDNYLKNYNPGYGMYGPYVQNAYYGGYGMNRYNPAIEGYGSMYGYVMPYGNYMYPNINSFGTYKNIDTYRSRKDLNKKNKNIENKFNNKNETDTIIENKDIGDKYEIYNPKNLPQIYKKENLPVEKIDENEDEEVFVSNSISE